MGLPDWYPSVLERQLAMTPQTWAALEAHGVTGATEVRLDFLFAAPDEAGAERLAALLQLETDYEVEVEARRERRLGPKRWWVSGTTRPQAVDQETLMQWVHWMVLAGAEYGACEFDGWGALAG